MNKNYIFWHGNRRGYSVALHAMRSRGRLIWYLYQYSFTCRFIVLGNNETLLSSAQGKKWIQSANYNARTEQGLRHLGLTFGPLQSFCWKGLSWFGLNKTFKIMNEFLIYTYNFLFKIPVTETAVCKRLSVAGRVYVFIAYKEGRIGAFFCYCIPYLEWIFANL